MAIMQAKFAAEPFQISVKNTFVHLVPDKDSADGASLRRSLSAPGFLRPDRGVDAKKEEGMGSLQLAWDTSTAAELSEEDIVSESGTGGSASPQTPRSPKQQLLPQLELQAVPLPPAFCLPAAAHASPGPPPTAPTPLRAPQRRLNSQAQAWTPCVKPAAAFAAAGRINFALQASAVVASATAALAQSFPIGAVHSAEGPAGWCIIAKLPLKDFARRDQVLSLASQSLLGAARASQSVYVLGGLSKPFTATPFGCSAMLGGVENEESACWDALAHGFCHRGSYCKWQHPSNEVTVNIMVKIAEGS